MKKLWLILVLLSLPSVAASIEIPLLNSTDGTFARGIGTPVTETRYFPAVAGAATIKVYNGAQDDTAEKVSSSVISINGVIAFDPSKFSQNVSTLTAPIQVKEGENKLEVQLKGKVGGKIKIDIFQEIEAEGAGFVGEAGGVIEVRDPESPLKGFTIEVLAGSVSADTLISINLADDQEESPDGNTNISQIIELTASKPIVGPVFAYYPLIGTLSSEDLVRAVYFNEETEMWEALNVIGIDLKTPKVAVTMTHFSKSVVQKLKNTLYIQPGPNDGVDIYINDTYSPSSDNEYLAVGGWGDYYYSLIRFDITNLPTQIKRAEIYLYSPFNVTPEDMLLDKVNSYWDETTDWSHRPQTTFIKSLPPATDAQWYIIDVTDLYKEWKNGSQPNLGIMLWRTNTWHSYNVFCSSDYITDAKLRPKLVITLGNSSIGYKGLPDTGQEICYDNTAQIQCPNPGEPFYGQDGNYPGLQLSYWPSDNGGSLIDKNTGLMWPMSGDGVLRTQAEAAEHCESLTLSGYSDWRLPSRNELLSIVTYHGQVPAFDPALNFHYGSDVDYGFYLTSNQSYNDPRYPWYVHETGSTTWGKAGDPATAMYNTRCVRGNPLPASSYTNNGNATITDLGTGLMWQQGDSGQTLPWQNGLSYCEQLNLAGYTDWRMPNIRELLSLVDLTRSYPAINSLFSCSNSSNGPNGNRYWSGTTCPVGPSFAQFVEFSWYVDFNDGHSSNYYKGTDLTVRCVRGGQ